MKEAAGEANMTVITIVLIAIVLAVGTFVVQNLMGNVQKRSACSNYGGSWYQNQCCVNPTTDDNGKITACGTPVTCTKDGCGTTS